MSKENICLHFNQKLQIVMSLSMHPSFAVYENCTQNIFTKKNQLSHLMGKKYLRKRNKQRTVNSYEDRQVTLLINAPVWDT